MAGEARSKSESIMDTTTTTSMQNALYGSLATVPQQPGEQAGAKPVDNKSADTHEAVAPAPDTSSSKGHHVNTYG